jgi:signal transduction histidine kinase
MATGISSGAAVSGDGPIRPRWGPITRWSRGSDGALAVIVFVLEVVGILGREANEAGGFDISMFGDVEPATYTLLAASSIALLWRRSRPLVVLSAPLLASLVWDVIGLEGGPSLAIFVSLYGVGRYVEGLRTSRLALGAAFLVAIVNDLIEGEPVSVMGLSLVLVFVPWYVGRRIRGRREYLVLLEERAEYLERERAAAAQRAADEERTRIARELHDVVAHRVSMITVQAGAAQTVAGNDPERAVRAMKAVEEEGRQALHELRQVLGVLRADNEHEGLAPTPGLAAIPELVKEMSRAGVDVSLSNAGAPGELPAGVDLASYRIVQEALTNVLKHAGPSPEAEVRLYGDDQMLTIEVTDRGAGVSTLPGSGRGLVGMRERTALLGGTFEAGPRSGGGFRIMARLPLDRSSL